jgi:hypothetical protein
MLNKVHRLETVRAEGTVAEQERLVWRSRVATIIDSLT